MPDPVTIGFTALTVGSKIFGGLRAQDAAEDAAREQAKLTDIQRTEQIRQREMAQQQTLGEAKARAYAGNLQPTGSTGRYLSALDTENMRELAYARFARKKEMEAIREGAQGAGDAYFYDAAGDLLGAAARTYASTRIPSTPGGGAPLPSTRRGVDFSG